MYLHISQFEPEKFVEQLHKYAFALRLKHFPPFLQGFVAQIVETVN